MARPLPVRPERIGGSAATDDDVEGRRHLRSPAPSTPFFDVSLPPSSVGVAQNERNTWFRGLGPVISQQRGGGSAATDADVEVRRHLCSLPPRAPFFDVGLPPSSGRPRSERTETRGSAVWRCHFAADGMNLPFIRWDESSTRTRPVTVRAGRLGTIERASPLAFAWGGWEQSSAHPPPVRAGRLGIDRARIPVSRSR